MTNLAFMKVRAIFCVLLVTSLVELVRKAGIFRSSSWTHLVVGNWEHHGGQLCHPFPYSGETEVPEGHLACTFFVKCLSTLLTQDTF